MIGEPKDNFRSQEQETKNVKKLTREEVIERLSRNEHFENVDIADLDLSLSELNFEGKRFCGSDIRGLRLCREKYREDGTLIEIIRANIRGADFTDAIIADQGTEIFFRWVDAVGASFGYTEDLLSRRKRQEESGNAPIEDSGGLFCFNGSRGDFRKTTWTNIDFGGGSGYEAIFHRANLSESIMNGCDLREMDFSESSISRIKIIDPVSLWGMRINLKQIEGVAESIEFTDQEEQAEFLKEKAEKNPRNLLEEYFGIIIEKLKLPDITKTGVSSDYFNEFTEVSYCVNSFERGTMPIEKIYERINIRKREGKVLFQRYEERYPFDRYNYDDPNSNKENIEKLNSLVEGGNKKYREGNLSINDMQGLLNEATEIIYGRKRR